MLKERERERWYCSEHACDKSHPFLISSLMHPPILDRNVATLSKDLPSIPAIKDTATTGIHQLRDYTTKKSKVIRRHPFVYEYCLTWRKTWRCHLDQTRQRSDCSREKWSYLKQKNHDKVSTHTHTTVMILFHYRRKWHREDLTRDPGSPREYTPTDAGWWIAMWEDEDGFAKTYRHGLANHVDDDVRVSVHEVLRATTTRTTTRRQILLLLLQRMV